MLSRNGGVIARIALTLALFLAGVACAGDDSPGASPAPKPSAESASESVRIQGLMFTPQEITVPAGTTVTWTNNDPAQHTVTSGRKGTQGIPGLKIGTKDKPNGLFDDALDPDADFSFTFDEPGEYKYFCRIHPGMTGSVVVE